MLYHKTPNNCVTRLTQAIGEDDIFLPVVDGSRFRGPCWVKIEDEIIEVAGRARAARATGEGPSYITWTAAEDIGDSGNYITIWLVDPQANDSPLSVDVDLQDASIIVNLATDGTGAITSTLGEVADAVNRSPGGLLMTGVANEPSDLATAWPQSSLQSGNTNTLEAITRGAVGTSKSSHPEGALVSVFWSNENVVEQVAAAASCVSVMASQMCAHTGTPTLEEIQLGSASGAKVKAWKLPYDSGKAVSFNLIIPQAFIGPYLVFGVMLYSKSSSSGTVVLKGTGRICTEQTGPSPEKQVPMTLVSDPVAMNTESYSMIGLIGMAPCWDVGLGMFDLVIERDTASDDDTFDDDIYLVSASLVNMVV